MVFANLPGDHVETEILPLSCHHCPNPCFQVSKTQLIDVYIHLLIFYWEVANEASHARRPSDFGWVVCRASDEAYDDVDVLELKKLVPLAGVCSWSPLSVGDRDVDEFSIRSKAQWIGGLL